MSIETNAQQWIYARRLAAFGLGLFVACFLAGAALADVESYRELISVPDENVAYVTSAESTLVGTAITDRAKASNSNTTVALAVRFSGAASDTVVASCLLYKGTTFLGLSTATATAGSYVDATDATQITAAGGRTLTFAEGGASADTVTASTGSFITDGYAAGMTLVVAGTSSNNGSYNIDSVTATVITIDNVTDDFAAEGPISATSTLDANGYFIAPTLFFDLSGADNYEVRFAAPSSGGIDATWWAFGSQSQ